MFFCYKWSHFSQYFSLTLKISFDSLSELLGYSVYFLGSVGLQLVVVVSHCVPLYMCVFDNENRNVSP